MSDEQNKNISYDSDGKQSILYDGDLDVLERAIRIAMAYWINTHRYDNMQDLVEILQTDEEWNALVRLQLRWRR